MPGFVFDYGEKLYRLLHFGFGSDNSFYFNPTQREAEISQHISWEIDEHGVIKIDPNVVKDGGFPTRKITRHPSGIFHLKDTLGEGGRREKDGLKGLQFSDVMGFHVILLACPQAIETLVEIRQARSSDIIAHLPYPIEPFTLQFAIWDKKTPPNAFGSANELLGGGVIKMESAEQPYGLIAALCNVRKTSSDVVVPFPKKSFYIVQ